MKHPSAPHLLALFACLLGGTPAAAETRLEKLPDSLLALPLVNGPDVRRALEPLSQQLLPSTGWLESAKGKPLASVTFVGEEGYFLTKASEVARLGQCRLKLHTGDSALQVREIRRDVKLDLVLGLALAAEIPIRVTPVRWAPSLSAQLGQWLCSPGLNASAPKPSARQALLQLGVLSAARRPIPGQGAALGISMAGRSPETEPDENNANESRGVRITSVAAESPARQAGLQEDDILIEVAGQPVLTFARVNELVKNRQPGDEILVRLLRDGKEIVKRVRLASRSRVIANWEGDDYANGGISIRTDDYPEILQHDLPLNPWDMGGPVFNLQGHAIAINIARADRISTFALPMERFRDTLDQWLKADRHPPTAEKTGEPGVD
jgi:serine protease Do